MIVYLPFIGYNLSEAVHQRRIDSVWMCRRKMASTGQTPFWKIAVLSIPNEWASHNEWLTVFFFYTFLNKLKSNIWIINDFHWNWCMCVARFFFMNSLFPLQFPFSIFIRLFFTSMVCFFLGMSWVFSLHIWYGYTWKVALDMRENNEKAGFGTWATAKNKSWTEIVDYLVNLLAIFNKFEKCVIFFLSLFLVGMFFSCGDTKRIIWQSYCLAIHFGFGWNLDLV